MPVLLHGVLTQLVQLTKSHFWGFGSKSLEDGAASLLHNPELDAAKICFTAKAVRQPRCCQRDKAVCFVALILRETERLVRCFDLCFRLADCWALEPMVEHQRSFCCFLQTIQGEVEVLLRLFHSLRGFFAPPNDFGEPFKGLEDPGVAESLASRAQPEIALQCYLSESKTTLHPKPLKPQPPPP